MRVAATSAFREPVDHVEGDHRQRFGVGHPGAELAQGLAQLVERGLDVALESHQVSGGGVVLGHDALELHRHVGEPLAEAVMQVAGDADPLLLCAEGAEPAEPAGVVDGECEHLGEPRQQHRVVGVVAGLRRMLQAEDADDLAPGGQPDVQAGTAGPDDRSERLGAGVEVPLADHAVVVEGSTERRRQVGTRIGGPQSAPVGDLGHPLLGVVVEGHQADDPGVEAVLELLADPLQGFAQRQRVGEGARHHVEHLEELVGLRQVVDLAEESDATAFGVLDAGPDVAGDHDGEDQGDDSGDVALVGHHVGDGPPPTAPETATETTATTRATPPVTNPHPRATTATAISRQK